MVDKRGSPGLKAINNIIVRWRQDFQLNPWCLAGFPLGIAVRCLCGDHILRVRAYIQDFLVYDTMNNGGAGAHWPGLLAAAYPALANCSLEQMLTWVVERGFSAMESSLASLDFVEYACGQGNLSKALLKKGFQGCSLDIIWDDAHDCLTAGGLLLWLECLQHLRRNSLVWLGTKCSSWVSLCVSQSERGPANNYHGNLDRDWVVEGNRLMLISSLIYFLSVCLGHFTSLEQPGSSCMVKHPWLLNVLSWACAQKHTTYLGAYGSKTAKPVQLWSTRDLNALARPKPNLEESLATREPGGGFTGIQPALQESEVYPELFGLAVANIFAHERA